MLHLISIDLEDWFHLLELDQVREEDQWSKLPSRLEIMTSKLLDFFDVNGIKATFFVLGWIADKYPNVIQQIVQRGHELGCHSYSHILIHELSRDAFQKDLDKGITAIEKAANVRVKSFRAPGFSINTRCVWALDSLAGFGIEYDSSIFPSNHAHGGIPSAPKEPFIIRTSSGDIKEFPISTFKFFGRSLAFSGGGYFRLFPLMFHEKMWTKAEMNGHPVIMYLHPRDFDLGQPRIPLSLFRQFKTYINVEHTFDKLASLMKRHQFGTLTQVAEHSINWSSAPLINSIDLG